MIYVYILCESRKRTTDTRLSMHFVQDVNWMRNSQILFGVKFQMSFFTSNYVERIYIQMYEIIYKYIQIMQKWLVHIILGNPRNDFAYKI